eukprot:scaffold150026_cov62-Attheya_sp.AAC.3
MSVMGSDHHPSESATVLLDREYEPLHNNNNDAVDNTDAVRLRLRLHLVRHGETESNRQNLVLGQTDSPLTPLGVRQAHAASRAFGLESSSFWRRYTSDLPRAQRTATILLGGESSEGDALSTPTIIIMVTNDERLRERAKGVREQRDKSLTYDEAMKLHLAEVNHNNNNSNNGSMPLLESETEVWDRFQNWMEEVLQDMLRLSNHHSSMQHGSITISNDGTMLEQDQSSDTGIMAQSRRDGIYDVLVVSHSGTLRTVIGKLVRDQLPSHISTVPVGKDGAKKGSLHVPNTSRTIIDIFPNTFDGSTNAPKWRAKLVDLTNTSHFDDI